MGYKCLSHPISGSIFGKFGFLDCRLYFEGVFKFIADLPLSSLWKQIVIFSVFWSPVARLYN